jgi:hypothetical protein
MTEMQQSLEHSPLVERDSEGILGSARSVVLQCLYISAYLPCMQVIILFLALRFASKTCNLVEGDLLALLTAKAKGTIA